jgi:hypothetical protein
MVRLTEESAMNTSRRALITSGVVLVAAIATRWMPAGAQGKPSVTVYRDPT